MKPTVKTTGETSIRPICDDNQRFFSLAWTWKIQTLRRKDLLQLTVKMTPCGTTFPTKYANACTRYISDFNSCKIFQYLMNSEGGGGLVWRKNNRNWRNLWGIQNLQNNPFSVFEAILRRAEKAPFHSFFIHYVNYPISVHKLIETFHRKLCHG